MKEKIISICDSYDVPCENKMANELCFLFVEHIEQIMQLYYHMPAIEFEKHMTDLISKLKSS